MLFSTRLQTLRKGEKITQPDFAKKFNISKSTVAMYETGAREPDFETLIKFADYFGVSTDSLLGRTEIITNKIETVNDNHGVIGDTHAPVTINNGSTLEVKLGDIEKELLSICGKLDMKRKNALLAKAYERLEGK